MLPSTGADGIFDGWGGAGCSIDSAIDAMVGYWSIGNENVVP